MRALPYYVLILTKNCKIRKLLADSEHLGSADCADSLGSGLAVFHCNLLFVFHVSFSFALYTIRFHNARMRVGVKEAFHCLTATMSQELANSRLNRAPRNLL